MSRPVKFKRIITGYRCHEEGCSERGVWYVETSREFFHWCRAHTVSKMRDTDFWAMRKEVVRSKPSTLTIGSRTSSAPRRHASQARDEELGRSRSPD